jgi:Tol biopolymer transport system component
MLAIDWSSDSTELYAVRMLSANNFSVWTVPLLGGTPRVGPQGLPSPDGRYFLTPRGVTSADGGSLWPKSVPVEQTTGFAWSPDSRYLAHAMFERGAVPLYSVHVCELASREVRTLVRSDLPIVGVAWLSNSRLVFARMERTAPLGNFNLWTVDLNPVPGSRQPARWTQWNGFHIRWLSATGDGKRVAFRQEDSQSDVYIARLEAGGTRMTTPERLTLDDHEDYTSAWMPGDREVLFESDRTGSIHIYRQAIGSLNAELFVGGPGHQVGARISPDDRWLLYLQTEKMAANGSHGITRLIRLPKACG